MCFCLSSRVCIRTSVNKRHTIQRPRSHTSNERARHNIVYEKCCRGWNFVLKIAAGRRGNHATRMLFFSLSLYFSRILVFTICIHHPLCWQLGLGWLRKTLAQWTNERESWANKTCNAIQRNQKHVNWNDILWLLMLLLPRACRCWMQGAPTSECGTWRIKSQ